jgi:hypothetical protein
MPSQTAGIRERCLRHPPKQIDGHEENAIRNAQAMDV